MCPEIGDQILPLASAPFIAFLMVIEVHQESGYQIVRADAFDGRKGSNRKAPDGHPENSGHVGEDLPLRTPHEISRQIQTGRCVTEVLADERKKPGARTEIENRQRIAILNLQDGRSAYDGRQPGVESQELPAILDRSRTDCG